MSIAVRLYTRLMRAIEKYSPPKEWTIQFTTHGTKKVWLVGEHLLHVCRRGFGGFRSGRANIDKNETLDEFDCFKGPASLRATANPPISSSHRVARCLR
jgi:hypothetical protein